MGDEPKASVAAIRACVMLRTVERLLASSGFYAQANAIREQRGQVEKCSVVSVDELNPDHGIYTPSTIGKAVDTAQETP